MASKKSGGDSTSVKTKTPKLNMAEEIAAINAGKKGGYTDSQRDSVAKTFPRKAYDEQIATQGSKSIGKKKTK